MYSLIKKLIFKYSLIKKFKNALKKSQQEWGMCNAIVKIIEKQRSLKNIGKKVEKLK
jgi:hypothetical protein